MVAPPPLQTGVLVSRAIVGWSNIVGIFGTLKPTGMMHPAQYHPIIHSVSSPPHLYPSNKVSCITLFSYGAFPNTNCTHLFYLNVGPTTVCPVGFSYMYDACYAVPTQASSWIAANDVAADLGGGLASIQSFAQNRWLTVFLRCKLGVENSALWLGLNSISTAGSFVWTESSNAAFKAWAPSQPSSSTAMKNCVTMSTAADTSQGLWSDNDCAVLRRPIVRYTTGVAVRFVECKLFL